MTSHFLDLQGLKCPLPVLRTRKALLAIPPGGHLVVTCTDPLSRIDIPHLVLQTGDVLEGVEHVGGCMTFRIRREPQPAASEP
jgi:tRNA 2-thiouridine synthesizing protein A